MLKRGSMRLLSILYLVGILFILSCSAYASELESGSVLVPVKLYATAAIPQVYTYVLRAESGATQSSVDFKSGTSSFQSIITNAPYRVGELTLSHYKLSREPISKFSLAKRTYEYITLESNTTIRFVDGVTSTIQFIVDKNWVLNSGGAENEIALYIFDDSWKKLETRVVSSVGSYYTLEAVTNMFGYFAIALDKPLGLQDLNTNTVTSSSSNKGGSSGALDNKDSTSSSAPQSLDTKTTKPVEVVYPLNEVTDSQSMLKSNLWQQVIGYSLLVFALTGVIIIATTVIQSRKQAPIKFKSNSSVSDLLAKLQTSHSHALKKPRYSTDVNALLAKVNARYQPSVSASMPKLHSTFLSNTSTFASSLSHSLEDLKEKVSQLEPDLIRRYKEWGISHGHSLEMIKKDLLEHEIDEDAINRILHSNS